MKAPKRIWAYLCDSVAGPVLVSFCKQPEPEDKTPTEQYVRQHDADVLADALEVAIKALGVSTTPMAKDREEILSAWRKGSAALARYRSNDE